MPYEEAVQKNFTKFSETGDNALLKLNFGILKTDFVTGVPGAFAKFSRTALFQIVHWGCVSAQKKEYK